MEGRKGRGREGRGEEKEEGKERSNPSRTKILVKMHGVRFRSVI